MNPAAHQLVGVTTVLYGIARDPSLLQYEMVDVACGLILLDACKFARRAWKNWKRKSQRGSEIRSPANGTAILT
jgi:hypothetical protein